MIKFYVYHILLQILSLMLSLFCRYLIKFMICRYARKILGIKYLLFKKVMSNIFFENKQSLFKWQTYAFSKSYVSSTKIHYVSHSLYKFINSQNYKKCNKLNDIN